jgi:hypothetical protein
LSGEGLKKLALLKDIAADFALLKRGVPDTPPKEHGSSLNG